MRKSFCVDPGFVDFINQLQASILIKSAENASALPDIARAHFHTYAGLLAAQQVIHDIGTHVAGGDVSTGGWQARRLAAILRRPETVQETAGTISRQLRLSRSHIDTIARRAFGASVTVLLARCRISHAKKCLATTDLTVKEVAFTAGFKTQAHFSRLFKRSCKVTPSEYRQSRRSSC